MFRYQRYICCHVLKLIVFIITITNICGCAWNVKRLYEGDERPLNEIAVLLVGEPVFLARIDDIKAYRPCFLMCADRQECHLLPGIHSITAYFSSEGYFYPNIQKTSAYGKELTVQSYFSAGSVYRLKPIVSSDRWRFEVVRAGTIDEVVCSSDPGTSIWKWADLDIPPSHWIEYAQAHCPEKSPIRN